MFEVFPCIFHKVITMHDEALGNVVFTVRPYHCAIDFGEQVKRTGLLTCCGYIQKYEQGTPLLLKYDADTFVKDARLEVVCCKEHIEDYEEAVSYMKSAVFKFSNKKTAENIVNKLGYNLFGVSQKKDAIEQFASVEGVTKEKAEEIADKMQSIVAKRRLIEYITKRGGTCIQAQSFFKQYDMESIKLIKKNPFLLRFADVPFPVYDKIAREVGIKEDDERRIEAIVSEAINCSEGQGNTYASFHELCKAVKRIVKKGAYEEDDINPFLIAAAVAERDDLYLSERIQKDNTELTGVYKQSTYKEENNAADHIVRLIKNAKQIDISDDDIKRVEESLGITYAEEQKKAFYLLDKSGIAILTGGPGTGKTTTLNGVIRCFEQKRPSDSIALCAPTAAAAKRMKESTGKAAFTVHKLLDIQPTGYGGYTSRNAFNKLEYDFIVVDEASMLDLSIFSLLVSAIKSGAILLFLGDKDQLSAVGPGNVLYDLMHCKMVKQVHLQKVFRQAEKSSIVMNSIRIREKKYAELKFDDESEITFCNDADKMILTLINTLRDVKYGINEAFRVRIFTPARNSKFQISTENLNILLQKEFNPNINTEPSLLYGTRKYVIGDPVVFTRNNYCSGYLNGDTGIITAIENISETRKQLVIRTDDGIIFISGEELADIALAYATTVHKSQGSECDTAIIMLPCEPSGLLRNDLVYVAATRAKKKNIFIVQNGQYFRNALEKAILTSYTEKRTSGLLARIEKGEEKGEENAT